MIADMPRPRYQYTQREISRHGKVTWYFRVGDGPRKRLPDEYGSPEFVAAWKACMAGETIEAASAGKHTLQWLVDKYQASAEWKALKPSTQKVRANILKNVCKTGGALLIPSINRKVIASGRDRRGDTPAAALNFMKVMNYLFDWAVDAGYARSNPVKEVKRPKNRSAGHKPWTEEDVITFYRQHGPNTQARLAIEMILFTGLRRGDVWRIGPQHIKNDVLELRAEKNDQQLHIPLDPILKASLERVATGHLAYLVTPAHGRPFKSKESFGNWFGKVCKEAGVPSRAHGIRKTVAQKLAEAGGSNAELKALFGWTSDAMATLYTRNADRKKLSEGAAQKLMVNSLSPHPSTRCGNDAE